MTLDAEGNPIISPEKSLNRKGQPRTNCAAGFPAPEWIHAPSFLGFVGIWAVLILMALTMSGEKMPWLTTHLTTPLIFITGAYLGSLLEKVDWRAFMQRGWAMIILMPIFLIALANVVGPYFVGTRPFGGLERDESAPHVYMAGRGAAGRVGCLCGVPHLEADRDEVRP